MIIQKEQAKIQKAEEVRAESASQSRAYKRLLEFIKPYWLPFTGGCLAAIPSGAMDGAIAWLAGRGLQTIFIEGHKELIYYVPLVVLVVAALQGGFRFFEKYLMRFVGASTIRDVRNALFSKVEKQPLLYFQGQSSGILIGRITNDVAIIEQAISDAFQSLINRTITLISLVVVLFVQSWQLTLIAVSILSFIVLPVAILGRKIRKGSRRGQEAIGDLVSVISESIQGAKIIQSFNLEPFQLGRFTQTNERFFAHTMKAVRADAMQSPILTMIGAVGIAAVIWVAGYQVLHNDMTLGALTSFVIALLLLYAPIKTLGRINGAIQPALAAAHRVFDVLDLEPNLVDRPGAKELQPGSHALSFENVSFQYPNSPDMVLRNINLEIPAGRMVALVGLSGAGKSTLVNLVPRFFDPTAGVIRIDGSPAAEYTLHSLRAEIAMVTQDNFLFNATVLENIRLGNLNATTDEVEAAAKSAYCHDFISELPGGYATEIGERGVRLSGGQQQRLAIARAFLKNAPVLILDEATSSLDNESEAMVQAALDNLMKGRTVIVIAHRLTTVRHADEIIVMDNGSIVESGTHESLTATNSIYARLLSAQFKRPGHVN